MCLPLLLDSYIPQFEGTCLTFILVITLVHASILVGVVSESHLF